MLKLDVVGCITKGRYAGWYLVVKGLGDEKGFLIIISKENLFDNGGNLQAQANNEAYDLWLVTPEEVQSMLKDAYRVKWL